GVDHSMKVMTEETFGPVLPIMRVESTEEALRLANDSRYGLDSSVFTRDLEKGERLARRVQAGATCVNDGLVNYFALEVPFGGMKESGMGARHGPKGIQKYCQTQQIMVRRFAPKKELHFFPYRKRVTKGLGRVLGLLYGRWGGRG
ncbi:MAG: aldehyde dehydrogenase family protein, partial [Actinomycetota bacterium]|nr:aldehyde dehydrogenase family protein [Actinomycetota bacterium]